MSGSSGHVDRRSAILALAGLVLAACGNEANRTARPSGSNTPATPSSGASTPAPSPVVTGANAHLTRDRLGAQADAYAGRWVGAWSDPVIGTVGKVRLDAAIDPDARTFTVEFRLGSDLLPGVAVPPFRTVVHADEFVYDATSGDFNIERTTPLGRLTIASDQGVGSGTFLLKLDDIPGVGGVSRVVASGVAFHPDEVPLDFTVHFADGLSSNGRLSFTRMA